MESVGDDLIQPRMTYMETNFMAMAIHIKLL